MTIYSARPALVFAALVVANCTNDGPPRPYVSQEERAEAAQRPNGMDPAAPDGPSGAAVGEAQSQPDPVATGPVADSRGEVLLQPGGRLSLFTFERVPLRVVFRDLSGFERDVTHEATFNVRNQNALTVQAGQIVVGSRGSESTTITATYQGATSDPMLVSTFSPFLYLGFEEALTLTASNATITRSPGSAIPGGAINGAYSALVSYSGTAGQTFTVQMKLATARSFVNAERMQLAYRTSMPLSARCGSLNGPGLVEGWSSNQETLTVQETVARPSFQLNASQYVAATDARYVACTFTMTQAGSGTLVLDDVAVMRQFIVGANLAWLDGQYEHDFGRSYHHPAWNIAYNPAHVDSILAASQALGIRLLRVWVFEGCEGLEKDSAEYVTGVGPEMWTHFDDFIFRRLPQYDIKVYLMMVGAKHMHDCSSPSPFDDQRARDALYDNAVLPFVARYAQSPWVWGIDLMNEPEGGIAGPTGNWFTGTSWANARSFLSEGASAVKAIAPQLYVSSGSGWHQHDNVAAGRFSGLGFSHLDWHAYNNDGTLPTYESLQRHARVLIGEMGQFSSANDPALQARVVARMFTEAAAKHYWGVMPWALDWPGATNELSLWDPTSTYPTPLPKPALLQLKSFVESRGDVGP